MYSNTNFKRECCCLERYKIQVWVLFTWAVMIDSFFWASFSVWFKFALAVSPNKLLVPWVFKSQSPPSVSSDLFFSRMLLLLDLGYQLFDHNSARILISHSCAANKVAFLEEWIVAVKFVPVVMWIFELNLLNTDFRLFSQQRAHLCLILAYLLVKPVAK